MLETSVMHEGKRTGKGLLFFSIIFHLIVVAGLLLAATWTVALPNQAPSQTSIYALQLAPPLPPASPPSLRRGNPAAPRQPQSPAPSVPSQPSVPDTVPEQVPASPNQQPAGDGLPSPNGGGDPFGDPNGPADGDPNGVPDGTGPAGTAAPLYNVGDGVSAPVTIHRVDPRYTELMRRSGARGTVVLQCIIDRTGSIREVQVKSSQHPLLNASAADAVRQWRFKPGMRNGQPVDVIFYLTVRFELVR